MSVFYLKSYIYRLTRVAFPVWFVSPIIDEMPFFISFSGHAVDMLCISGLNVDHFGLKEEL